MLFFQTLDDNLLVKDQGEPVVQTRFSENLGMYEYVGTFWG